MKKILVIMLMLSAVSYGWSQTCESMVSDGNADYDSILKSIQIEDDITQDSVLMEQLALILEKNSNNTDLSSKNPNKIAAGVLNIFYWEILELDILYRSNVKRSSGYSFLLDRCSSCNWIDRRYYMVV